MISIAKLRSATRDALAYVSGQTDVAEAEIFASANGNLTVRLNYTSHIPSNGVEEPKSIESYGIGIRAVFHAPGGLKTGFGCEPTDLSLDGVARALDKARLGAVHDPEFVSLPQPMRLPGHGATRNDRAISDQKARQRDQLYDPSIMRLGNNRLVETGWRMLDRGLDTFQSSEELLELAGSTERLGDLGLILGGDLVFLQERMAIASTRMPRVQTDQSTMIISSATAMVEQQASKGSGWSVANRLRDFTGEAAAHAVRQAIKSMGGHRIPTGAYNVVLGPQPLAEILEWILMPGLQLDMFYAGASPLLGQLGQRVASSQLSIFDDGAAPDLAGSKSISDEGLPTGRTDLIRDGVLAGLLSDHYNYQRILNDPDARKKLGVDPARVAQAIAPRNGFRPGNGGGRDFSSPPSITPTNLIVQGQDGYTQEELLRSVGDGVYIGRIWYTYPVNGISAGDFSGTIVGDSYLIKNGRLADPIRPNTLRMNDNVLRVINNILGIGSHRQGTVRWSSDQVTWAPELAVADFQLEEIAEDLDGVQ